MGAQNLMLHSKADDWHVPPQHTLPLGQTLPHCPQFCSSFLMSTQPVKQHHLSPQSSLQPHTLS
jgi:hypothetical protein